MKHLLKFSLLTLLFLSLAPKSYAQLDAKIAPMSLIWAQNIKASVEYGTSDVFGIEGELYFNHNAGLGLIDTDLSGTGVGIRAFGKYYFNPKKGLDGIYLGPYIRFRNTSATNYNSNSLATGLFFGYKQVTDSGIIFEAGFGAGRKVFRNTTDDTGTEIADALLDFIKIDFPARIAIGYRFSGNKTEIIGK